jgi:hypothetical protein
MLYLFWPAVCWGVFVIVCLPHRRRHKAIFLAPTIGVVTIVASIIVLSFGAEPKSMPPPAITDVQVNPAQPTPSGIDSDGWLADRSGIDLAQPRAPSVILVKGMVPLIADPGFTTELHILIDGQEVGRQVLGVGELELRIPAPPGPEQRRVELHFSAVEQLPAPDGRPVGARIGLVGFEAVPTEPR